MHVQAISLDGRSPSGRVVIMMDVLGVIFVNPFNLSCMILPYLTTSMSPYKYLLFFNVVPDIDKLLFQINKTHPAAGQPAAFAMQTKRFRKC